MLRAQRASRILDGDGRILQIVNNYSRISFNFGPTLLSWLDRQPGGVPGDLEADRESRSAFSGHGSAMAQAYNHMILPLANRQDKYTQILWGIAISSTASAASRKECGWRKPRWTCRRWRCWRSSASSSRFWRRTRPAGFVLIGGRAWRKVDGGRIDPSTAYAVRFREERRSASSFTTVPFHAPSRLRICWPMAKNFSERLLGAFSDARTWPQLVHIATDGETYGHHRGIGDMALAYALNHIESGQAGRLTNYGEYLEKHPPTQDAKSSKTPPGAAPMEWSAGAAIAAAIPGAQRLEPAMAGAPAASA